jgi:hypothetical protein
MMRLLRTEFNSTSLPPTHVFLATSQAQAQKFGI